MGYVLVEIIGNIYSLISLLEAVHDLAAFASERYYDEVLAIALQSTNFLLIFHDPFTIAIKVFISLFLLIYWSCQNLEGKLIIDALPNTSDSPKTP